MPRRGKLRSADAIYRSRRHRLRHHTKGRWQMALPQYYGQEIITPLDRYLLQIGAIGRLATGLGPTHVALNHGSRFHLILPQRSPRLSCRGNWKARRSADCCWVSRLGGRIPCEFRVPADTGKGAVDEGVFGSSGNTQTGAFTVLITGGAATQSTECCAIAADPEVYDAATELDYVPHPRSRCQP